MLDFANDCSRFVTGYFEIISASSPHIYHSALVLAPKKSAVRELYGSQVNPFVRVVHGALVSWDTHTAAMMCHSKITRAVWSPCDRFIAVTYEGIMTVDVLDSATLQRLQTLESTDYRTPTELKVLAFSPDSRTLTCSSNNGTDRPRRAPEFLVISWDLQTGGVVSVVRQPTPSTYVCAEPFIVYSANGSMAGVFYQYLHPYLPEPIIRISIFDITSGICTHSHLLNDHILLSQGNVWVEGESLRFLTADAATVTIWEVGFTSSAPATKVDTLPLPTSISRKIMGPDLDIRFSPVSSRFALTFRDGVRVWDGRNSRYLLCSTGTIPSGDIFFSLDGRFLACSTARSEVYLWKDSPTGFILYGILTPSATLPNPLLSQNGESLVMYGGRTIQLWHSTKGFPTTPPGVLTQAPKRIGDFILDISPNLMLAVVAMRKDEAVTVLDLNSGVLRLTIDTGMEVYGLGVVKNAAVVIGCREVFAWNLPLGDGTPGARAGLEDRSRMIGFVNGPRINQDLTSTSISPDSRHIALTLRHRNDFKTLSVYHATTGQNIGRTATKGSMARFSLDGLKIWCAEDSGRAEVRGVTPWDPTEWETYKVDTVDIKHSLEGCPWESSHGYRITDDWWILGPDGKRLLMLPPPWRSEPLRRVWKGRFLGLLHHEIQGPIILELP